MERRVEATDFVETESRMSKQPAMQYAASSVSNVTLQGSDVFKIACNARDAVGEMRHEEEEEEEKEMWARRRTQHLEHLAATDVGQIGVA